MLSQYSTAAHWLLLPALPIAAWVIYTDLSSMKIRNQAVMALIVAYAVIGFLTLPLSVWSWSWLHLVVVLVIGFALNMTGSFGAGDAKFAAAMAPFIALGDLQLFLVLLGVVTIAAFVGHRLLRRIPAVRAVAPTWESWERRDFPFGLALAPALVFYLGLAAIYGQ